MCRCWCLFCACVRPKYGRSTTGMANVKTPFEHGLIWRLWSYNTRSSPVSSHRSEQQLPVRRTMDGAEICGRKCGLVASLQCHQAMHGKLWHTHTHCHPIRGKLDRAGGGRQNAFGAERPEAHGSARCYPWVNGYGKPAFVDVFSLLHTWLSHCQAKLLQKFHRVSSQGMSWLEMGMQPGTVLTIVVVEGEEGMGCQAADWWSRESCVMVR